MFSIAWIVPTVKAERIESKLVMKRGHKNRRPETLQDAGILRRIYYLF